MFAFERPEDAVEDVAAHIADGTVAKIVPAMPLVRMKILVVVAVGRRADPFVPMQAGGHRDRWRAWALAPVSPVGPAVRLGNLADDPGPDVLAEATVALFAMALAAHLSRYSGVNGHGAHGASLADVVADR